MNKEDFEEMPVTRQEVWEMIREAQQGPRIRKNRIKECVDRMFEERTSLTAHTLAEISAECALAALGCIIVDDLPEETRFGGVDVSNGPLTGEQAMRLRALHEARELIDALIQESAEIPKKEPEKNWKPIEEMPLYRYVLVKGFSPAEFTLVAYRSEILKGDGIMVLGQPHRDTIQRFTHYCEIPAFDGIPIPQEPKQ